MAYSANKSGKPIGIDLTRELGDLLLNFQKLAPSAIPAIGAAGGIDLATGLIPVAYVIATDRYMADHKRGLIMADEGDNPDRVQLQLRLWWIAQANFEAAMPRICAKAKDWLAKMLAEYRPEVETIIVRRTYQTLEPFRVRAGGHMETPGILPNNPVGTS